MFWRIRFFKRNNIIDDLLNLVIAQFRLSLDSPHGVNHWKRVENIGVYLARFTGADVVVVRHFAYLHDSQRTSDGVDIEHGLLAKAFTADLISQRLLALSRTQARLLQTACEVHNTTHSPPQDPTVATCLDADRLDLWRLGIQPSGKLMFTQIGKKICNDESLDFWERYRSGDFEKQC